MEYVEIDPVVLSSQVGEIGDLVQTARTLSQTTFQNTLSAAYSDVSGLDQMGASHGLVMQGGVGSAVTTLQKYAEQVAWLRDGLRATERSLSSQEGLASRAMEIADQGGSVGSELTAFPARPDQNFEDFDFPTPSVSIPSSIAELSAAFAGTDGGAVTSSAESWSSMAKNALQLAESIRSTAWDIAEINKADSINQAVEKALDVASAADTFAKNAELMSTSITYMGQVADAGAVHVAMAELALAFIQDPVEREAAEKAFLNSFMGSEFPAAIESAMPATRNLMKLNPGGTGGGELQANMGLIDGNGRPGPLARIAAGSEQLQSLIANPGNIGAGSFGEVAKNMADLDSVGAQQGGIGNLHTGLANAFGGVNPVGGGFSAPVGGGAHAAGSPSMGTFAGVPGFAPMGAGSGRVGAGFNPANSADLPRGGSGFGPVGIGNTDLGQAHTTAAGVAPFAGAMGRGGVAGGLGAGSGIGGVGRGASVGGGSRDVRKPMSSVVAPGFVPGGMSGALPVAATAVTTSQLGSAGGRGFMPMGGMPLGGQSQEGQRGKVKTVTSKAEEDGNISALLGDLPPVVPGPIGAWARN